MLLGAQTPTFSWSPPAYTTAGADEAAKLIGRAGQPMDPWQVNSLRIGMGEDHDGLWVANEVGLFVQRQNGKGGVVEARGLYGLFVRGEKRIIYTAHLDETAANTFERVVGLIESMPDLKRRIKPIHTANNTGRVIETTQGATWAFRTRGRSASTGDNVGKSGGKGRGLSCDCLFMDEALYIAQETMDAILPTMLARMNPQVWWISTPPITASAPIVKIRADGEARKPRLALAGWWNEPDADLEDERVMAAVNPAYGIRLNAGMLELLKGRLGPAGYARECGGKWPVSADATDRIDAERWKGLQDKASSRVGDVAIAVDIAPDRSWSAIGLYGERADGLGHVRLTDYRPGTSWLVGRMVELRDALGADLLGFAMGRGTAKSLEPDLAKVGITRPDDPEEPHRGDLAVLSAVEMAAACAQIIDAVKSGTLRHVPEQPLDLAIPAARTKITGDTIAWTRRDSTVDVTPVVVVTQARWLFEAWSPLMAEDQYDALDSFY